MAATVVVDRARWLGFRWQRHGLAGGAGKDVLDDLLLLGLRGGRGAGAGQALIQRTRRIGATSVRNAVSPDGPLVSMWSVRGAPHAHRVTHLDFVRDAHAPRESDEGGAALLAAVEEVAAALAAVVTGPTAKGTASAEVTARVAPALVEWCGRCAADHVPDGLFRAAGRHARLVLGADDGRVTVLHPPPDRRQVRVGHPRRELLAAYFRVNGPTGRTQFRDWMEAGTGSTAELWAESAADLVRVRLDGRRYDLPAALVDAVTTAPVAEGVALVPPNDPYLRQVDRTLLVGDSGRRREVWRALSAPGALLVDGEVAGTWRYRHGEGELTITPFDRLTKAQRAGAGASAELVGAATGDEPPAVSWA